MIVYPTQEAKPISIPVPRIIDDSSDFLFKKKMLNVRANNRRIYIHGLTTMDQMVMWNVKDRPEKFDVLLTQEMYDRYRSQRYKFNDETVLKFAKNAKDIIDHYGEKKIPTKVLYEYMEKRGTVEDAEVFLNIKGEPIDQKSVERVCEYIKKKYSSSYYKSYISKSWEYFPYYVNMKYAKKIEDFNTVYHSLNLFHWDMHDSLLSKDFIDKKWTLRNIFPFKKNDEFLFRYWSYSEYIEHSNLISWPVAVAYHICSNNDITPWLPLIQNAKPEEISLIYDYVDEHSDEYKQDEYDFLEPLVKHIRHPTDKRLIEYEARLKIRNYLWWSKYNMCFYFRNVPISTWMEHRDYLFKNNFHIISLDCSSHVSELQIRIVADHNMMDKILGIRSYTILKFIKTKCYEIDWNGQDYSMLSLEQLLEFDRDLYGDLETDFPEEIDIIHDYSIHDLLKYQQKYRFKIRSILPHLQIWSELYNHLMGKYGNTNHLNHGGKDPIIDAMNEDVKDELHRRYTDLREYYACSEKLTNEMSIDQMIKYCENNGGKMRQGIYYRINDDEKLYQLVKYLSQKYHWYLDIKDFYYLVSRIDKIRLVDIWPNPISRNFPMLNLIDIKTMHNDNIMNKCHKLTAGIIDFQHHLDIPNFKNIVAKRILINHTTRKLSKDPYIVFRHVLDLLYTDIKRPDEKRTFHKMLKLLTHDEWKHVKEWEIILASAYEPLFHIYIRWMTQLGCFQDCSKYYYISPYPSVCMHFIKHGMNLDKVGKRCLLKMAKDQHPIIVKGLLPSYDIMKDNLRLVRWNTEDDLVIV